MAGETLSAESCGHGMHETYRLGWRDGNAPDSGEWEPCDVEGAPSAPNRAPTDEAQPCLERGLHDPHRYGRLDAGDDDRDAGVVHYWCPGQPPAKGILALVAHLPSPKYYVRAVEGGWNVYSSESDGSFS